MFLVLTMNLISLIKKYKYSILHSTIIIFYTIGCHLYYESINDNISMIYVFLITLPLLSFLLNIIFSKKILYVTGIVLPLSMLMTNLVRFGGIEIYIYYLIVCLLGNLIGSFIKNLINDLRSLW